MTPSESMKDSGGLPLDLSKYPKLSREQAGHLRHFYNLSAASDGNWPHMGSQEPAQEFFDAYRYQLATMAYAASLTHYHRMPAMRILFRQLIHRLIRKMLRREVWGYWYLTSQSGIRLDPDLKEMRKPWADPVVKENIMYSGHLLLMTSLYAMLFNDNEFEREGSLTFDWDPLLWGMGKETFAYDNGSLQEAIIKEMERNGWIGVCCEPNWVFVVCNQFPLIAMRLNDVRNGTKVVDKVLEKYKAALESKNMISRNELYKDWVSVKQGYTSPARNVGLTAWTDAFMNTWNSDFVRAGFDAHALGFITNIDGKVEIQHPAVASIYRTAIAQQAEDTKLDPSQILQKARESYIANKPTIDPPYNEPMLGYVVQWLSELGKTTELEGLLTYVDTNLRPTWENGGLYYPRQDQVTDDKGCWTHMDPFSGNAAIAYSRLNVENGQKIIWDLPWTKEYVASSPWVDGIDLSSGVDCLRGIFDAEASAMIITLREWASKGTKIVFDVKNLPHGRWRLYRRDGNTVTYEIAEGFNISVEANIEADGEVDFVIIKED